MRTSKTKETELEQLFRNIAAQHQWRRTPQKLVVFRLIYGSTQHPSVEAVWQEARKEMPAISLETVYRLLNDFAEAGLCRKLIFKEFVRFDGNSAPHGHCVCRKCGKVFDLSPTHDYTSDFVELKNFSEVQLEDIRFTGICAECQKTGARG